MTFGPQDVWIRDLQDGYDRVAAEYAATIFDELQHKPFDRALLDRFVTEVHPIGPACDLGCGPGQVARYLHDRGLSVFGLDLSTEMLAQARRLNPGIQFEHGTMPAIPRDDESLGGITAFYSIIHLPRPQLAAAFDEMFRVLRPAGTLLVAFHLGPEDRHIEEFLGQSVSMDFFFFTRSEIEHRLEESGFFIIESVEREPYPEVEHQSRRAYILARKPASSAHIE
jgi:SAM-dependent methyltransferase